LGGSAVGRAPMTPRWRSALTGSEVYEADARIVAQTLPVGSVTCSILDGPYNLGKAEWDRVPRGGTLGDLYTGHLDDVGRLSAPSASLYLWNTSAGWAELHPLVLARGWTFRSLIVWYKPDGGAKRAAHEEGARTWPEVMEVCGFYQCNGDSIHCFAERFRAAGHKHKSAMDALGLHGGGRVSALMGAGGWAADARALPRWEEAVALIPDLTIAEYDDLRAEYEASRPPFTCPLGVGNVWTQGAVHGSERLRSPDGGYLHPCQKPLLFAERMIRASTRPGDTVWVPFGGTLREMVAAERMARGKPSEARRVISCELNADGVDYIGPAVAQAQGLPTQTTGQADLFGGGK